MYSPLPSFDDTLASVLNQRHEQGLLRKLTPPASLIDFCSNDYLSFAQNSRFNDLFNGIANGNHHLLGATGSRLISGNTSFAEELEKDIAAYHFAEAGLLFNSGYDANLGLLQCLPQRGDTVLYDQFCHASIIDGMRLSYASRLKFMHNDIAHLEKQILKSRGKIFVVIESVYSMDGDCAPLQEFVELCEKYNASLIVDEAHATGVFGEKGDGLVAYSHLQNRVFARIHTFGKALGCHGAIVLGSKTLRNYLINFARSFIYTTALPFHSLAAIKASYGLLQESAIQQTYLHELIAYFKQALVQHVYMPIESNSAIQCIVIGGNRATKQAADTIRQKGFDVRAILSPTVPEGKERLRICLHAHNTPAQVNSLIKALGELQ